jgi:hypothetical protein
MTKTFLKSVGGCHKELQGATGQGVISLLITGRKRVETSFARQQITGQPGVNPVFMMCQQLAGSVFKIG